MMNMDQCISILNPVVYGWMMYVLARMMSMDQYISLFNSICMDQFNSIRMDQCVYAFIIEYEFEIYIYIYIYIYTHLNVPLSPLNFPKIWGTSTCPPCASPRTRVSLSRSLGGTLRERQRCGMSFLIIWVWKTVLSRHWPTWILMSQC